MRKSLLSILLSSSLFVACTQESSESLMLRAQQAMDKNDYKTAELLVKQAIGQQETNDMSIILADVYLHNGNIDGAVKELDKIKSSQRTSTQEVTYQQLLAHIAMLQYDFNYQAPESTEANCSFCQSVRAWAMLRTGESNEHALMRETATVTEQLAKLTNVEEAFILADLYLNRGQPENAVVAFEAYLTSYPNTLQVLLPYSQALIANKQHLEAEPQVDRILKVYDKSGLANYLKAYILAQKNQFAQALNYANTADAYDFQTFESTLLKALLEFNQKKYESAYGSLEKALSLNPNNDFAKTLFLAVKIRLGADDAVLKQLAEKEQLTVLDVAAIGQSITDVAGSQFSSDIQQKLSQQGDNVSLVVNELITLAQRGESDLLAQNGNTEDPVYNLIQVSMLLQQQKYDDALAYTNQWLERTDDRLSVLNLKGAVLVAKGDREAARRLYQETLTLSPTNRAAHMFTANQAGLEGDYSGALAALSRILDNDAEDINALKLYVAFDRLADASSSHTDVVAYLKKAIDKSETKHPYQLLLAGYYVVLENPTLAKSVLANLASKEATQVNQYWEIQFNIAKLMEQNKVEQVYKDWAVAFPNSTRPALAYAQWLNSKGQTDKAVNIVKSHPNVKSRKDTEALFTLGLYAIKQGYIKEATSLLSELEKDNLLPATAISYLRGFLAFKQGNLQQSIKHLQQAYEASPSKTNMLMLSYVKQQAGQDTSSLIEAHLQQFPQHTVVRSVFAESLIGKDNSKALYHFNIMLSAQPNNAKLLNNIAWLYYLEKDFDSALANAERAQSLAPADTDVQDTLITVHHGRKAYDKVLALTDVATTPRLKLLVADAFAQSGKQSDARDWLSNVEEKRLAKDDKALYEKLRAQLK